MATFAAAIGRGFAAGVVILRLSDRVWRDA
jgi:hypothetical protein